MISASSSAPLSPPSSDNEEDSNHRIVPGQQIDADEDLLNELPNDVDSIELVQLRISSIPALRLDRFTRLQSLCLRENLIEFIEGLEGVGPSLVELDLYDNAIERIANLGPEGEEDEGKWLNLESLDLSFNQIRKIKHVSHLRNLKNLYFVQNRIGKIENLDGLQSLVNLELGGNRLRVLENLDSVPSLTQLWVGKNKITKMANLSPLKNLKILSIQANRITKIEGLEDLEALEELYISHNGLTKIEGLEKNLNLHILDITSNAIEHVENLSHLRNLEELWASSNKISSFDEIEAELKGVESLETVYFEGNPIQRENPSTYRNKVRLALGPGLKQIDASMITESQANIR
ncbi:protein phosphatase PP1 regulatory subunit sds22 [Myxozyma melibiosi]|uniref:Protein phosphatase PP1 regulatory subunit sds22 n=1 Tax=Myxozyma melibiosi TaxID=54550 RepID=A0ABR1F5B7_9ASCO